MEGRALLQYIIDISDVVEEKKQEAREYLAELEKAKRAAQQTADGGECANCGANSWTSAGFPVSHEYCTRCGASRGGEEVG